MGKKRKHKKNQKRTTARPTKPVAPASESETSAIAVSSSRAEATSRPEVAAEVAAHPESRTQPRAAMRPAALEGEPATEAVEPEPAPEEHRAQPRVSLAVEVHMGSDSHFFAGLAGDVSEGGLFVSTYRPLAPGDVVDLEFSIPGSSDLVHARGEVRWLREHSAQHPRGVGIAFSELAAEDRERIHDFCTMRPPLYYDDVG